jgi:hypothetical protein
MFPIILSREILIIGLRLLCKPDAHDTSIVIKPYKLKVVETVDKREATCVK